MLFPALWMLAGCLGDGGGGQQIINPNPTVDTIGPAGGSLVIGDVELVFPANAVSQPIGVTVRKTSTFPLAPLLVAGTAYELGPPDVQFAQPVQLTIRYDPDEIPTGVRESELRLFRVTGSSWEKLGLSQPDGAQDAVTGEIGGFSVFGVLGVPVASVSITPQTAAIETGETRQLTATVEDAEGLALPQREVLWRSLNDAVAEVDASGLVTGLTPGSAEIQASSGERSGVASVTVAAPPGDLQASMTTTGQNLDPDGYNLEVDGSQNQAVGINGQVTFTNLAAGDHTVRLTDVASNCTVSGSNPRTVTVPSGGTAQTTFDVTCASTDGDLQVSTITTGQNLDPNGFNVVVDGTQAQAIGINGTVVFSGLAAGDHTVQLTGVASNCTVSGSNPRTVTVPSGGTTQTTFDVTCTTSTGDLQVSAATTGQNLDPDGYTVVVDGMHTQPIGVNGQVTFNALAAGDHTVQLTNVASNCSVSGSNPRTVSVPSGGTGQTTFDVTCTGNTTGDLQVTTSTKFDDDGDKNGYVVVVDGTVSQSIAMNDVKLFQSLSVGDHDVELTDVDSDCKVEGSNPRTVTVSAGGTAQTTFKVKCDD